MLRCTGNSSILVLRRVHKIHGNSISKWFSLLLQLRWVFWDWWPFTSDWGRTRHYLHRQRDDDVVFWMFLVSLFGSFQINGFVVSEKDEFILLSLIILAVYWPLVVEELDFVRQDYIHAEQIWLLLVELDMEMVFDHINLPFSDLSKKLRWAKGWDGGMQYFLLLSNQCLHHDDIVIANIDSPSSS